MKRLFIPALPLLLLTSHANASDAVQLGEVTVKGEAMSEAERSFTVNTVEGEQIRGQHWESPLAIIETMPGVDSRPIQAGSVADPITIRGMTSGGHGGDVGFSLDGINMNEAEGHADGYADTSVIIPLEIEKVSVYKGPVSPLYGNFARGGVMAFTTRKEGEYTDLHLARGSFDTKDTQAAFGEKMGDLQLNGAMQGYDSEGWRDNSRFTKMNGALRAGYKVDESSDVALSLREHGAWFDGPGNIGREQFLNDKDRHKQAPAVTGNKDGGEKTYGSQRIDYNKLLNPNLKLLTFVYQTDMTLTRFESSTPTPGIQVERTHNRDAFAYGASLNGEHKVGNYNSHWVLGAEIYNEDTQEDQWSTVSRVRGAMTRNRDFVIDTKSLYGQMDLDIHKRFRPTLGFRYDDFAGSLNDHIANSKSDLNDFNRFSPKLGVRSELTANWELRASVADGFALPTSAQKYDPNIDVDAVKFRQYELGVSGAPTSEWYVDVAYFILNSSDEIQQVAGSAPPEFVNAGKTTRSGLESEVRYFPAALSNFELSANLTLFDAEIEKNVANPALEGNEPQRLPEYMANLTAEYSPELGWGGQLSWRAIGEYYTNNENAGEYDGYDIFNGTVFYTMRNDQHSNLRWYLDVNNLTDEEYAEGVSGADANGNPTSYNPRPPRSYMIGAIMSLK